MSNVYISKTALCRSLNFVKKLLLVIGVIALGTLVASGVASSDTSLMMTSETEDYIGQGLFHYYSSSDGDFNAWRNYNNGVSLSFHSLDYSHWWYLDFSAPNNAPLTVGTYIGATRFPFKNINEPGLEVYGDGNGCNTLSGSFIVKEVTYGSNDEVLSFWATFEHYCDRSSAALRGEIRYNAASPNSVTGIKTTSNPSFDGQSITFSATVAGAGKVPTGRVTFKDGNKALGTVRLFGNPASAVFTTSTLSVGTHSITAIYRGKGIFNPSSSAVLSQAVEKEGSTILMMDSDPGDYFVQGYTYHYSLADGTFTGWRNYNNGVSLSFHSPDYGHWWYLDFAAPDNAPLTVGTYIGATRFPFKNINEPGLEVYGDGNGCNMLSGSFAVKEVSYGPHDEVLSFWATFEQYCDGSSVALRGVVRFHADVPDTNTRISSPQRSAILGQSVAFTATVTCTEAGVPSGRVNFMDGATVMGTAELSGNPANAFITTSDLSPGIHYIKAIYAGDDNFSPSDSDILLLKIDVVDQPWPLP